MKTNKTIGKVRMAAERLAVSQPFHGALLARWDIVADESVGTMAVGFRSGRLMLYVAPTFVSEQSLDALSAVLEHEANHVAFGHTETHEGGGAMVVAKEVTANEFVLHAAALPGAPVVLKNYPMLPPNEDTQTRYEKLRDVVKDTVVVVTVDCHGRWAEIHHSPVLAKKVIEKAIADAVRSLSQKEKARLHPSIRKSAEGAAGCQAGEGESSVSRIGGKLSWTVVLRRFVGRATQRHLSLTRPPRRYPDLVGIVRGSSRSSGRPVVMAVVDTSSSMTPPLLAQVNGELAALARRYEVIVVEADTKIQAQYAYRSPISSFRGRGGTDLRCVFTPERMRQVDVILVFTDGDTPMLATRPHFAPPTLWVLTPRGHAPASWGREVRMG